MLCQPPGTLRVVSGRHNQIGDFVSIVVERDGMRVLLTTIHLTKVWKLCVNGPSSGFGLSGFSSTPSVWRVRVPSVERRPAVERRQFRRWTWRGLCSHAR
jgi:hypothetical protein